MLFVCRSVCFILFKVFFMKKRTDAQFYGSRSVLKDRILKSRRGIPGTKECRRVCPFIGSATCLPPSILQKWNRIVDKVDKNVGFSVKNAI